MQKSWLAADSSEMMLEQLFPRIKAEQNLGKFILRNKTITYYQLAIGETIIILNRHVLPSKVG